MADLGGKKVGSKPAHKKGQFWNWLGETFGNLSDWFTGTNLGKSLTGSGMTDSAKEEVDYSMASKEDFYINHESLPAKMQEARESGINPFVVVSGGVTGASASSAAQSSAQGTFNPLDFMKMFLDFKLRKEEISVQRQRADNEGYLLEGRDILNRASAGNQSAQEARTRLLASYESEHLSAQTEDLRESINERRSRIALNESGISVNKANAALTIREEALKAIQEKYNYQYWENSLRIQEAEAALLDARSRGIAVDIRVNEQLIKNLQTENDNMLLEGVGIILDNGKNAHEFSILGVEADNAQHKTEQENRGRSIDMVTDVIDSVVGIGTSAASFVSGSAALRSAGSSVSRARTYANDIRSRILNRRY